MVKKKQPGGGVVFVNGVDLKSLIHSHSVFLDGLVELIPAKFYLPTDTNEEKVWFQGLSKSAKAKAKKATLDNTKKARRDRLDPLKSSKTTLDILKESLSKDSDAYAETRPPSSSSSVTYEELRQRLRNKIEELRGGRGGDEESRKELEEERKRKRDGWFKMKEDKFMEKKAVAEAAEGIEFGKLKLGDDDKDTNMNKNKKRKLSKEEELERARRLVEEGKKDATVAEKHSWDAATSRAMGVKVHDDPKLIKESMMREKRRHKKSVDTWKDRVKSTESGKKERQDKRKGNIQAVIEKKKMKKIERREKKLMKRPGFEGRKDGYINGK